ncbi:P-loop containing nucleoside triphosphate hydrolase protein [Lactarius pseudohatsudake]|nr:P-loop containing nucleoside triphosphate hydrolase protein [Lactarius pseudohatsudake]
MLWQDLTGEWVRTSTFLSFLSDSGNIQELSLPFISAPSIVDRVGYVGRVGRTLRETFEEAMVRFSFAKVANPLNQVHKRETALARDGVSNSRSVLNLHRWSPNSTRAMCKVATRLPVDFNVLAKAIPGYVGADLSALPGAAGIVAFFACRGVLLAHLCIIADDFVLALKEARSSAPRKGFATIPDVTWVDAGALHAIRSELHMRASVGSTRLGQTLLAKAVANESQASFVSVKGAELLNKLDAFVPRCDKALSESSARVINALLTELDGLNTRRGVFVLGATNRPNMFDPAMCRPGRLDKLLHVDLPSSDKRAEIVRTLLVRRSAPLAPADSVTEIIGGERGESYSGADLAALVREAGVKALRRALGTLRETDGGPAGPEPEGVVVQVEDF